MSSFDQLRQPCHQTNDDNYMTNHTDNLNSNRQFKSDTRPQTIIIDGNTYSRVNPDSSNMPNPNTTEQSSYNRNSNRNFAINKIKPKEFDGDMISALDWFRQFCRTAENNCWDDEQKVRSVSTLLVGKAADWYTLTFEKPTDVELMPYYTPPLPTWTEFSEKFFNEFHSEDIEILLERKLTESTKSKDESYTTYASRVLALIMKGSPKMSNNRRPNYANYQFNRYCRRSDGLIS